MLRTFYRWHFTTLDWLLGEPNMVDAVHHNAPIQRLETFDGHWLDIVPVTRREKRPRSFAVLGTFYGFKVLACSPECPLSAHLDFLKGRSMAEARASYQAILNIQRQITDAFHIEDCHA